MACDIGMFINRRRDFEVFFKPFLKSSHGSLNILLKLHPATLICIYHSTFLCDGALIFGGHWKILDGIASFEVCLYTRFTANVLKALLHPLVQGTTM